MPKANPEDQVKNEMIISVLEGQEILKRIQLCKEDLFKGFPIDAANGNPTRYILSRGNNNVLLELPKR